MPCTTTTAFLTVVRPLGKTPARAHRAAGEASIPLLRQRFRLIETDRRCFVAPCAADIAHHRGNLCRRELAFPGWHDAVVGRTVHRDRAVHAVGNGVDD